jgi:hypothetical protein
MLKIISIVIILSIILFFYCFLKQSNKYKKCAIITLTIALNCTKTMKLKRFFREMTTDMHKYSLKICKI